MRGTTRSAVRPPAVTCSLSWSSISTRVPPLKISVLQVPSGSLVTVAVPFSTSAALRSVTFTVVFGAVLPHRLSSVG